MTDTSTAPAPAAGAEPVASTVETVLAERKARRATELQQPEPKAEAAPEGAAPAEETPPADQGGGEAEGGAETPAAEAPADGAEPAEPAVQPPQYWSKEAKAKFAELPPELQAVVAEQEAGGERARSQAKQAAAEARKAAEKEAGTYREAASRLGQLLPQLEREMAGKWADATPEVWAEAFRADPQTAAIRKAEYEADMAALQAAKEEHGKAEAARHDDHVKAVIEELPSVAPALADPKDGPKRIQEVATYLGEQGIPKESLQWASAAQLGIAYKAMLYDRGQAAPNAQPRKDPKPASPPLKPAAAQNGSSTQQRLASLDAKAARTGSFDDVMAARRARREASRGR
jgi:hypothetical protein